jgi:hypothetical protein
MKSKYNVGDKIYLTKIWTPKDNGGYIYPDHPVVAVVLRKQDTPSLGWSYHLGPLCNTDIGKVMYWESDIAGHADDLIDAEEELWKTWGDR